MTSDPELKRIVRSWLEDGATVLPDRVVDSVMAQLPATRQRRRWLPAWRDLSMNTYARLAAAVAVVSILVIGGISLSRPDLSGGSGASPSPTASPGVSPSSLLPMAPVAWCEYADRDDVLETPPDPYATALAAAADFGEFDDWRRVGPEYLAMVREARSTLSRLEGLAPLAGIISLEARGLDDWIAALEASLAPDAGSSEANRVYDAWRAWTGNRITLTNAMQMNFEEACG